jgi:SAM-dependent methyltransferase
MVCGSAVAPALGGVADAVTSERFSILVCRSCGLKATSPQPADLMRHYGPRYHGGRHGATGLYCSLRRAFRVWQVLGPASGRKLLDIGCGDGTFLDVARRFGWRGAGTELNPSRARERGLEVFETIEAARRMGPYTCITLWHSLEHLPDPREALSLLSDVLEPAGALFVAVPNADGWQARLFGRHWFHLDVPRHLYHFGPRSLRRLLVTSGLEVRRRWDTELEYDVFGWTQSALNAVTRRPNELYESLIGRNEHRSVAAWWAVAGILSSLAVPVAGIAALAGRGSTLVLAARAKRSR